MASEIKPGQWINVKVTAEPRAVAARKTMIRVFEKDETVSAERKRLHRARPVKSHTRGGRPWYDRPARLQVVKTTPGASYKLFASVDVLRDLESLSRYVEITPA
jgi:hypothetical protein